MTRSGRCSAIATMVAGVQTRANDSLEHLDSLAPTRVGARLRIREKIGGIPGEVLGSITAVEPGMEVTWEADARYRWLGVPVRVGEGVTCRVEPIGAPRSGLGSKTGTGSPTIETGRPLGAFLAWAQRQSRAGMKVSIADIAEWGAGNV